MDLTWSDSEDAFRSEARTWLEANVPDPALESGDTKDGFAAHLEWEHRLAADRWAVVSWPEEYGGRGASLWEWLIFEEEYYRAGAPQRVTQNGIFLLAPTIFEFGTKGQQDYYLPRMSAAVDLWCQGWSEPNAGSDLAGVRSKATRDDAAGGWVLSGQKTWTTRGAFCNYLFGLFRTDPESERHKGLTYFMVPLEAAGVTVRGFGRLDGDEGFAEVFFDDVFIPDSEIGPDGVETASGMALGGILGEVNQGWGVAMATTSSERGLTLRSPGRFQATASRLLELAHEHSGTGSSRSAGSAAGSSRSAGSAAGLSEAVANAVTDAWIDAEAYSLYTLKDVSGIVEGRSPGARSSYNKIFWSELDVRLHQVALDILGPEAELEGPWMKGYEFALSGPIYAGTNEIQRNIVAERVLGLPRK
ncbi:MAG: acyl-CoA dehydrogenase family protein [Microthrixaceae bacterium]